ncbi:hypothetical protein CTEN210_00795 [Chaetoceros tenuissimus]|uniref:Uncharacterized protein n=1 Tax=Chaetoceros tenuissimus TaxID=426638 RepID=A0AAD3CEG9_9STRA|nr:hypothetical protein CTEN210_00795 [Chaetoceros tenuissimus]
MKSIKSLLLILLISSLPFPSYSIFNNNSPSSSIFKSSVSKSKSLFKVDPSKIITLLCKHGNIVLPSTVQADLQIIAKVCHATSTSLDLIEKELIVEGFTISHPDQQEASLYVEKFILKWDSYRKPCLEITLGDVHLLMEFLNLILTKNNWHELQEMGFPPVLSDDTTTSSTTTDTSFIRIGSFDAVGEVRLKLKSRPLSKELCEDVVLDLDKLSELNRKIVKKSNAANGRVGCTTEELYEILQSYIEDKIKALVKSILRDPQYAVKDVKNLLNKGKNVAKAYMDGVGEKADDTLQKKIEKVTGLKKDDVNFAKDLLNSNSDAILAHIAKIKKKREMKEQDQEFDTGLKAEDVDFQKGMTFAADILNKYREEKANGDY